MKRRRIVRTGLEVHFPRLLAAAVLVLGLPACGGDDGVQPQDPCEYSGITGTDESAIVIGTTDPADWCPEFGPAYPNPAAARVALPFEVTQSGQVVIRISSPDDGLVRTLTEANLPVGAHVVTWDLRDDNGASVPPGIYCATLQTGTTMCRGDIQVL